MEAARGRIGFRMTPVDLKHLGGLLDLLKSKGVGMFHGGGFIIEFEDATPAAPSGAPSIEVEPAPCACGHAHFEHSEDGMCLKGCDVEACAPPEKVTT